MKRYFHGSLKKYPYFEGWYLKHQNQYQTVAFIPAFHADKKGNWTASIQLITDKGAWYFEYPFKHCTVKRDQFYVKIGDCVFSEKGISVNLSDENVTLKGQLHYSPFTALSKDIMGPFRFVPFMECNHGVVSMMHKLTGSLYLNGKEIDFTKGTGYMETDWGKSFPYRYSWTQCSFQDGGSNSLMVSVASIPFLGKRFDGCICSIYFRAAEYRLATYRGVKIEQWDEDNISLTQGNLRLSVMKLGERAFDLKAPMEGKMLRIIKESPVCRVRYRFWEKGILLFDVISSQASYESVL